MLRVKEAKYRMIHNIGFYLYAVLEQAKQIYGDRKQISGCLGWRWGEINCKYAPGNILGWWKCATFDCCGGYTGVLYLLSKYIILYFLHKYIFYM